MNPVLGPVVATSPERRLSYLLGWSNGIFGLIRDGKEGYIFMLVLLKRKCRY
jgi:hypothetical protein